MTNQTLTDQRFSDLGLDPRILKGLEKSGFTHLTEIQSMALPISLAGKDLAGQGKTGTGKTAAFLLAMMQTLLSKPDQRAEGDGSPRAIIIAPTRELAMQIHKDALSLGGEDYLRFRLAYGGVDYQKQRQQIADGCDVLIGTPGRLIDYLKQKVYHLKNIEVMILDEADRMFDLGFIKDIRFMLRRMPKPENRQSMLFSATLSHRVLELAYEHMNNPEYVEVKSDSVTADKIQQSVYYPANNQKLPLLVGLLKSREPTRTMVFANMKVSVDRITRQLQAEGFKAAKLSGDVHQRKRQSLLKRFQNGEIDVLVATDVAARGLHIDDVSHVFNYDLPDNAEDYVHRIGRTARLGSKGDALSFACEDYAFALPEIEEFIGHKIENKMVEDSMLAELKSLPKKPRNHQGKPGQNKHRRRRRPQQKSS